MGGLFSRTVVVDLATQYSTELQQLENDIAALVERKQAQLSRKRRLTRALLLYGSMLWLLLLALLFLVVEFPNRTHFVAKCLKIGPLIMLPTVLLLLHKGVGAYYTIQWKKADAALAKLEASKATKLDELIKRTHFHETQKIISQFSEKKKQPPSPSAAAQAQLQKGTPAKPAGGPAARPGAGPAAGFSTPGQPGKFATMPAAAMQAAQMQQRQQAMVLQQQQQQMQQGGRPGAPNAPMLRSPQTLAASSSAQRGSLDKVLDFILNDGPNNKYALICVACYGHNGLVQEAELGKVRFRCAFCGALNGPPAPTGLQAQAQQQLMMAAAAAAAASGQPAANQPLSAAMSPTSDHAPVTPGRASQSSASSAPAAAAAPLTPFPPLPSSDDAALTPESDVDGAGAHARRGSRVSRSRRNSERKEEVEAAESAAAAAAAAPPTLIAPPAPLPASESDDDGFEQISPAIAAAAAAADESAVPRKRKAAKGK